MPITMNLDTGKRAERKLFITVAEWSEDGGTTKKREILGTRTEDSSLELNADIQTTTDVRGITYTDVNKTEPQQAFDPFYIIGGSELGTYLVKNVLANNIQAYNNCFDVYLITAFLVNGTPTSEDGKYYTVKHTGCSIIPTALGGDSYNNLPIECHLSNNITQGTVDVLTDKFEFTADV